MKTRISAIVCLLYVLGAADLTRAEDPYSQRVADPYALSSGLPTMSSGTLEPYFSLMAGVAIPFSRDTTFRTEWPTVIKDVDYTMGIHGGQTRGSGFQPETSCGDSILGLKSPAMFGIQTWPAVGTILIMTPREVTKWMGLPIAAPRLKYRAPTSAPIS